MRMISWFSCGATSAVACKLVLQQNPDTEIVYIETGSHHPDSIRFLNDCEKWFGKKIEVLQSEYKDVFDVISRTRFINSASGASCTFRLKSKVRHRFEYDNPNITHYAWGFDNDPRELKRAEKMVRENCSFQHIFPLIEANLSKKDCLFMLKEAGIELPEMYKLGYHNNNCIGCVKGGMGYWNKIRVDFPEVFDKMAKIEREIGHSCLKEEFPKKSDKYRCVFLDELNPKRGRNQKIIMPDCSIFCGMIDLD